MSALLCAQCNAPLSMEAAQGRVPCGYCHVINAPRGNPYGPTAFAQAVGARAPQTLGAAWICPQCRKENQAHYKFCLGCGGAMQGGVTLSAAASLPPKRSPIALIIVVVMLVLLGALGAVAALVLTRR